VRIVVAEDAALVREGLVHLFVNAGEEVVAQVADGPSLVAAVVEYRPDIAIVDVRMPPHFRDEGLQAALAARRQIPTCGILILSHYMEERYARELLEGGTQGVGYLLKERVADVSSFMQAARQVAGGGTVLDPEVIAQLVSRRRHHDLLEALSPRECDVLALMAEGQSNSAIAEHLVLTEGAVEKHIRNIFAKLELPPSEAHHRRILAVLLYLKGEAHSF
jgi:DNA-binding NarL/FixJ family response regulator